MERITSLLLQSGMGSFRCRFNEMLKNLANEETAHGYFHKASCARCSLTVIAHTFLFLEKAKKTPK